MDRAESSSSVNYLTVPASSGYDAASEVLSANYGNGVAATFTYNSRLQLATLAYAIGSSTLYSLAYDYSSGTANNGQIQSITDNVDNGRSATYTNDAWSRLKTAATTGSAAYPAWGLTWSYDRYGNRQQQSILSGCSAPMSCPTNSVTPSPTTNHLTDSGYSYDASGNMTSDGSNTLTYGDENRVTNSANGGSAGAYAFDGNSLRVTKTGSGATTIYIFSGTKVIAEYASGAAASSPSNEYIYVGPQLLSTLTGPPASATAVYHIADHLSPRVTTDSSGNVVGQQAHFPFGEDWYASSTTTKFKFTSYERDAESGNDYAMMRTSINRLGRFSSPDLLAGSIINPQSLNRYAYALNSPSNLADPSGLTPDSNWWNWFMDISRQGAGLLRFMLLDNPDAGYTFRGGRIVFVEPDPLVEAEKDYEKQLNLVTNCEARNGVVIPGSCKTMTVKAYDDLVRNGNLPGPVIPVAPAASGLKASDNFQGGKPVPDDSQPPNCPLRFRGCKKRAGVLLTELPSDPLSPLF